MIELRSEKNDRITSTSRTPVASVKVHFTYSQKKRQRFDEKQFSPFCFSPTYQSTTPKHPYLQRRPFCQNCQFFLKGGILGITQLISLWTTTSANKAIRNDQKRQLGKGGDNRAIPTCIYRIGAAPAHMFCLCIK